MKAKQPKFKVVLYQGRSPRAQATMTMREDNTTMVEGDFDQTPSAGFAVPILMLMAAHVFLGANHPDQTDQIQNVIRELEVELTGGASFEVVYDGVEPPSDDDIPF